MTKKKVVEEPSLPEPETATQEQVAKAPFTPFGIREELKALLDNAPRLPWGFMPPEIVKQHERPYRDWLEALRQLVQ